MSKKELYKEFLYFLKKHDALEEFQCCCSESYLKGIKENTINARRFLILAFLWDRSPSGEGYWRMLNSLWAIKLSKEYADEI